MLLLFVWPGATPSVGPLPQSLNQNPSKADFELLLEPWLVEEGQGASPECVLTLETSGEFDGVPERKQTFWHSSNPP